LSEDSTVSGTTPPAVKSNFVGRLWNGDISLVETYWLFGVLGGFILRILSLALTYVITYNSPSLSAFDISLISDLWFALVMNYSIIVTVGIWRSATKYAKQKPASSRNAALAKTAVILGILALIKGMTDFISPTALHETMNAGSVDERTQADAIVSGLNANLPKKLDNVSTLTKIDFRGNSFIYFIQISVKVQDVASFNDKIRDSFKGTCTDKDLSQILKSNINLTYVYSDPTTPNLATIIVSKADCTNL
jgi:hypothetical protein